MFDALARLADRRARRVAITAAVLFVFAGAVGGSVANRLDPYGADDPETEAVRGDNLLRDAGYRDTAVIVLFNRAPVSEPGTRAKVERVERELRSREDVA